MTEEIWKAVVGFEGIYEVSNLGRVRSLDRVVEVTGRYGPVTKHLRGKVLRPGPRPSGHLTVALGAGNTRNVHTLVVEAFVGPRPDPTAVVRHLNGREQDNRLENLEWSNRVVNGQDRKWHRPPPSYKLTPNDVIEIKRALSDRSCSQISLARKFNVNRITIARIRAGKAHADVVI